MNYDQAFEIINKRGATLIACDYCLNCLKNKDVAAYLFLKVEDQEIAVHLCRECISLDKAICEEAILGNILDFTDIKQQ